MKTTEREREMWPLVALPSSWDADRSGCGGCLERWWWSDRTSSTLDCTPVPGTHQTHSQASIMLAYWMTLSTLFYDSLTSPIPVL